MAPLKIIDPKLPASDCTTAADEDPERLSRAHRSLIVAWSQYVKNHRQLASMLGISTQTLDRLLMGCRAQRRTLLIVRNHLDIDLYMGPPLVLADRRRFVHQHGGIQ